MCVKHGASETIIYDDYSEKGWYRVILNFSPLSKIKGVEGFLFFYT